jgi:hypothetical protein
MADRLEDLLRDCTVQVTGGPMMGAGFFVAPGMVVTCAHVAGPGIGLQVRWERDDRPAQIASVAPPITRLADRGRPIPALDEDYPDLAVLKVDGFGGHPCVQIDTGRPLPQDGFLVFGYPREGGAIRLTPARLSYRGTNGTSPTVYLDLAWDTIKPGMSGAAVLNLRTGAVCAVVVASRNPDQPDGALAVPWWAVAADLDEVLTANRDFQQRDPRWEEAYRDSRAAWRSESPAAQRDRLRSYLAAARAAVARHPYPINIPGVPTPALSTVYLRQQLGAQVDQALPADAGGSAPGQGPARGTEPGASTRREPACGPGQEPATSPGQEPPARPRGACADPNTGVTADQIRDALQRFDIDDVLARNRGALILGGPGSGKSSLMRHVIEVAADSWPRDRDAFVPVLVHARTLLTPLSMNKAIADALRQDLRARLDDIDLDGLFAGPPMPGLAWLILLDGLDEITEARRRDVMDIVGRWWEDTEDKRYRFVIASRPLPDRELHILRTTGIPIFEIQGLSDDQLPILAARWFHALRVPDADREVGLFITQVRQARMAQLARNPLIATISCVVFARHPDRGLPHSRAGLYEEFTSLFLEKMDSDKHFLRSIKERVDDYGQQAIDAVGTLAHELPSFVQDLAISRLTGSELDLRTEAEQLAKAYWPSGEPPKLWNDVVAELLVHSGLISMRADDLAFTHETIAEYLAACARTTPPRSGRVGIRQRWQLVTRAGSNESYPLFVVALLLRSRDIVDLTRRPPALLQMRKLLHARLVAALVHDGCERELRPNVVAVATERLTAIATRKTSGIPFILRRGIWSQDDDCVMAAKALTLIDKDRGLDLLFTLAADPTVPSFSIFDVLAEVMVREDLTEIDSARGLSVLYRYASAPSPAGVEREEDSYNRMLIADLILDRDAERGAELLRTLARDSSMDMQDRMDCIERLVDIDKQTAIEALTGIIIIDTSNGLTVVLKAYSRLRGLDLSAAVAALAHVTTDPARGGYDRAVACVVLYHAAQPEGLRALRELSGDRDVPGFYRVYYFAQFGDHEERDGRLLELSRDTTLPAAWRAFAAEELSEHDREAGIDALRAIQQDISVGRRTRAELGMRAFLLNRFPVPPGLLARAWKPVTRLIHAENLVSDADGIPQSVYRYLLPHERLLGTRRPHPAPLLAPLSFVLSGLVAAIVLSVLFPRAQDLAAIWAAWGLVLLYLAWRIAAWSVDYLVLTDMRLLRTCGLLIRKVSMMPLGPVADMQFERPLFGLVFDYGTFSIASRGSTIGLQLKYMPHPGRLYRDLLSLFLTGEV